MFVRKLARFDRKTGGLISEKILGPVEMTKEEYWAPPCPNYGANCHRGFKKRIIRNK